MPSPKSKPSSNPLLARWTAHSGLPPFSKIAAHHFQPAFRDALKQHREEIERIARNPSRPTFANTIVAMERGGRLLNRVADVFFNLVSTDSSPQLQEIERWIAPELSRHMSAIQLNPSLYRRIADLHDRRGQLRLTPEQDRLLDRVHTTFVRAGARLDAKARARIAEINATLAELTTAFAQNVLADEQSWRLGLDGEKDLAGLPPAVRASAARTARELGSAVGHVITLSRSSIEPFLQFSSRRDLREEAFKAWISRGARVGATDNRPLAAQIIRLRQELAQLLGYRTYAAYALDDTMAGTPDAVRELLDQVWQPALQRASEERLSLQARARAEGANYEIAAWDWRYFAEKERQARFDLDEAEVRPYLQLSNIIEAAFDTASRLFGVVFREDSEAPRYHPDVRVWDVSTTRGEHVGIFMGDYFARPSKRSGAWMSSFRTQHNMGQRQRPIIVNVMNFARGADGEETLLSLDDARTLFHEFGHALHGLLSDVTYPSLAGTNVARDFVELPSQLFEHWLMRPEVLKKFALHVRTGKPMPDKLIKKINAARTFNQGFATVEYVASALVDMELHALTELNTLDVAAFESATLKRLGMPREIVMRHRISHFQHIMGGYAAGYYSYLWSEVMDADAFAAFEEAGDIYDKATARRLKDYIYAAGNRREPREAYIAFRGRAPTVDSLLQKRGFPIRKHQAANALR